MSTCEKGLSDDGLAVICLRNETLRVSILPEAGGKISELVDLRTGRNWLWANPYLPFARSQYGVDFQENLDSGGWDEILMSITPARLTVNDALLRIPDHGDVVGQDWAVVRAIEEPDGAAVCELTVNGRAANYQMTRTVKLSGGSSRIDVRYSIVNHESFAWPWYWCMHALLAADPDLQIILPAKQSFRIDGAYADGDAETCVEGQWPNLAPHSDNARNLSRNFASTSDKDRFAGKFFVRSPESGSVAVAIGNTSERLSLHYDPEQLPWLGLWINNQGWPDNEVHQYQNLGLEPATTPYDDVSRAVENDAVAWLQPGEIREWSLAVEVHS